MKIKRKSNWYIYVITLIISFVLLGFFVSGIWDSLFPTEKDAQSAYNVNDADFRPSADIKMNFLVMLSEMKAGVPDYYMLASYTPRSESVVFIPLPDNTRVSYKGNTGSLYEMYSNLGAKAVVGGIKETLDFECSNYIKFDRLSLIDFVDMTGTVYVNIPVDITETRIETFLETEMMEIDGEEQEVTKTVKKEVKDIIFPAGAQYFDGETLYSYITYDFGKGIFFETTKNTYVDSSCINAYTKETLAKAGFGEYAYYFNDNFDGVALANPLQGGKKHTITMRVFDCKGNLDDNSRGAFVLLNMTGGGQNSAECNYKI